MDWTGAMVIGNIAAYFGLPGFVGTPTGLVLDALDGHGLKRETQVLLTSDHGDGNARDKKQDDGCHVAGDLYLPSHARERTLTKGHKA